MRRPNDADILTIDADRIAAMLEQTGWPRYAAFVREQDGEATRANRRTAEYEEAYNALLRRLEAYEGTAEREHDPQPPPEASD